MADTDNGNIKRGRRTSIPCPKCGGRKSRAAGSSHKEGSVWRRRKCEACGERYTTYEVSKEDFKRLQQVYDIEGELVRAKDATAKAHAEAAQIIEAFDRVRKIAEREREGAEQDRQWQKDNPVEALRAVLPPPVFEYLSSKARKKDMPLMKLLVEDITFAVEIDISCSDEKEMSDAEALAWETRIEPYTVMNRKS